VKLATTAAATAGALVARRIARPVLDVGAAAHRVAGGDLTARASVRRRNDELGRLVTDFNTMAEELESLDRDRVIATATAAIAHELRSPLTVLTARLMAADDGLLAVDPDEIATLRRQVDALTWLVDDLRTLSLGTAGRLVAEPHPVDLSVLLAGVVDDMSLRDGAPEMAVDTAGLGGVILPVDPVLVERALVNLIDNAMRHTRDGCIVTIVGATDEGGTTMAVTSEGEPIDEVALPLIFEPFYRADPSRARHTGGSGLGLTIVRLIADAHGGTVEAENTAVGPRLTFALPVGRTSPSA